jgi:hypothetical protein
MILKTYYKFYLNSTNFSSNYYLPSLKIIVHEIQSKYVWYCGGFCEKKNLLFT